jgi:hypothetical protein
MKHVLLILAGAVALSVGVLILVLSRCATTAAVVLGSGFVLLGFALAIPAQLREAKGTVVEVASAMKGLIGQSGDGT